ncbi:centriole and centriolar satellite protein ofd1 isoform X1 [Carassius gibelio]|uniref:centriole and centriolar satellite protein ofd1 isoform X1 n=2 Tax=Carassius gibelio TaxID=101364 RepID=UPI0022793BCB|nr:centriole and centriolar satellite protein ofd1 isoform X1 [Carassius gibelio]
MVMSGSGEQSLSPDEMRQKLYQTFRSRGLLDALKTQLRNQLIQELQPAALRRADAHSVLVTACNSVIIHHLRSVGCDYTLSVFLPECGMSKDKVLSARELLQLMKISPHTPLYRSLASDVQKGQTGFLMSLFTELTEHHVYRDCCDASTQCTSESAHKESLVEKLQLIDEEYEVLRHRGDRWGSVEVKLAEYRKEIQEQAQLELKAKLQHFMEVEITKVKRDEKEASRREILELRRDLERTFELKSEALMSREKNAIERLQKSQEIEEKEMYAQRQALLKEIESVRSRDIELKQRMEAFDKSCKLHEEKVKTMEDLLRRRELSVKTLEDTFDLKLKSELEKYQLELKEDYMKRAEKLTENERRIKEETLRLQKESALIDAKAEERERSVSEVKRLLMELESSRAQASLLTQQNELLRERLENMSDYPALKRDAPEQQMNIRLLKEQLEDKQQENQRLRRELSAPSKEQLALQAEFKRLETAHKLDQEDLETQKNVLHTQLQHEVQQCVLLKAQLMECEERVKWMNTHTEELQLQLQQTQQALENEILRNPKPSLVDRSVLSLIPDKLLPPDFYIDTALLRNPRAASDTNLSEAGPALRGPWPVKRDSELVSSALARIRELEQEAERLDEAYRSHQHRATRASAGDLTPPRVTYRAQPRVSFTSAGCPVEQEFTRTPSPRERNPLRLISPPARRLSSTPLSKRGADADHDAHAFTQDSDRAALVFPERQISPIPAGESLCSISPPSSPRMKSTTRHSRSPPKLQEVISSSSEASSPQPEKITLHDLTDPVPLLSVDQEKLQESHTDEHDAAVEEEERRREEMRESESEREEEQEREEREHETINIQEDQHEEQAGDHREGTEGHVTVTSAVIGGGAEEAGPGADDVANPLHKYMMMLMQNKQKQQSSAQEASEKHSLEEFESENEERSVELISHQEPDDDFW